MRFSPTASFGLPALAAGILVISFSPVLVQVSEVGPSATAVYRMLFALPALTAALQDSEWQVRGVAALALGQIGNRAPGETVTALINGLGDDVAPVRMAAASALGEIGIGARQAMPGLRNLKTDEDPRVRAAAEEAVSRLSATQ